MAPSTTRSTLLALLLSLLLLILPLLVHSEGLTPPLPRRARASSKNRLPSPTFGVVVSPIHGAYLSPEESFHFQYAMATRDGSVTVELVSPATMEDKEERRIMLARFLTQDTHKKGIIDAWLGFPPPKALGRAYDGMTFKLIVTETEPNSDGRAFAEPPVLQIQGLEERESEPENEQEEFQDGEGGSSRRSHVEAGQKQAAVEVAIDAELRYRLFEPLVD